jgi:hypothetical protein
MADELDRLREENQILQHQNARLGIEASKVFAQKSQVSFDQSETKGEDGEENPMKKMVSLYER